ncbi:hypothetical protein V6N13_088228 [Hibiscus sabdariffa]
MWKDDVAARLIAFSNIHIDMEIEIGEAKCRFTSLHGFIERQPGARLTDRFIGDDYFQFDVYWSSEPECGQRVSATWNHTAGTMLDKLTAVAGNLQAEMHAYKSELKDILDKEETLWQQRSRVLWLREGDRNTKFFHERAKSRRKKNAISVLVDSSGRRVDDKAGIFGVVVDYFTNLYRSSHGATSVEILAAIETRVTPVMNSELCRDFTTSKVEVSFFQINPTKAHGLDGMPSSFFVCFGL